MLRVAARTWSETFAHLRHCGRRRVECIVYWTAQLDAPDLADQVVHPMHASTAWHYDVEPEWLTTFMVGLHRDRRTVVAQVHSHAGAAFHSATDDAWPLVWTPGLMSLVVPRFASGGATTRGIYLAEIDDQGRWQERSADVRIEVVT